MFGNLFAKTTTTIATGGSDTSGDAASAGFTTFIGKVSRANSKSVRTTQIISVTLFSSLDLFVSLYF